MRTPPTMFPFAERVSGEGNIVFRFGERVSGERKRVGGRGWGCGGFTPTLFRHGTMMFRNPDTMFGEGTRVGGEG
jgi:hypothetical protein